jgi:hypothetical protein
MVHLLGAEHGVLQRHPSAFLPPVPPKKSNGHADATGARRVCRAADELSTIERWCGDGHVEEDLHGNRDSSGRVLHCAMRWRDVSAFEDLLVERLVS